MIFWKSVEWISHSVVHEHWWVTTSTSSEFGPLQVIEQSGRESQSKVWLLIDLEIWVFSETSSEHGISWKKSGCCRKKNIGDGIGSPVESKGHYLLIKIWQWTNKIPNNFHQFLPHKLFGKVDRLNWDQGTTPIIGDFRLFPARMLDYSLQYYLLPDEFGECPKYLIRFYSNLVDP